MRGVLVGVVKAVKERGVFFEVYKRAVGDWFCTCGMNHGFVCKHKQLVWRGRNRRGKVQIVEPKALLRGWMPGGA